MAALLGVSTLGAWLAAPASAFTLGPPVHVTDAYVTDLAAGGDTVAITWTDQRRNDIVAARSLDRGLTFGADETVQHIQPTLGAYRILYPHPSAAIALSDDGATSGVLSAIDLQDTRLPPLAQDRYSTTEVEFFGLGLWRRGGGPWLPATGVDAMTDKCDGQDRRCMLLTSSLELAFDEGGGAWAGYTGWDHYTFLVPPFNEQLIVARVDPGAVVARPIDLSPLLLGNDRTSDDIRGLATDATGDRAYVAWYRGSNPVTQHLAVTTDGGLTWADQFVEASATALGYARDAGVLAWATIVFGPSPNEVIVRTSTDDGATFGPDLVVDRQFGNPGGAFLMIDHLELAISRDGQTMAVAYEETDCTPLCSGMNPSHVVLSASDDGGATWSRLGILGEGWANTYDVAVSSDGATIYAVSNDPGGGTNLFRAE